MIELPYWLELLKARPAVTAWWAPWRECGHTDEADRTAESPRAALLPLGTPAQPCKGPWCTSCHVSLLSVDMFQRSLELFAVWVLSAAHLCICSPCSCCTQPLAFRSCIAEDGLNFSLFLILHFQLGFPAIRQLEAYFQVPAVPVTYQRLNFWLHVCSIARAKVADSNQSCSY